jgi:hypothetical protein
MDLADRIRRTADEMRAAINAGGHVQMHMERMLDLFEAVALLMEERR